ncbi:hypothetical protein PO124_05145 [Bacillus licheniformis]|nr:hypothetical protein [Bacillus licheniformis]
MYAVSVVGPANASRPGRRNHLPSETSGPGYFRKDRVLETNIKLGNQLCMIFTRTLYRAMCCFGWKTMKESPRCPRKELDAKRSFDGQSQWGFELKSFSTRRLYIWKPSRRPASHTHWYRRFPSFPLRSRRRNHGRIIFVYNKALAEWVKNTTAASRDSAQSR